MPRSINSPTVREPAQSEPWSRFRRLVAYYLDCIEEQDGEGVSELVSDEDRKFILLPLEQEWGIATLEKLVVPLQSARSGFEKELSERGASASLFYGYPIYVRPATGGMGTSAIPVFLQRVEAELKVSDLHLSLNRDWPRVNPEFLNSFFPTHEERRAFVNDLGLLDMEGDPPSLADIVRKFVEKRPPASIVEPLNPERLITQPPVSRLRQGGLYNRASLVFGGRSTFTAGLEYELNRLGKKTEDKDLQPSALRLLFSPDRTESNAGPSSEPAILEVVRLNDEQRDAVRSGLRKPLTVVTGPPGTGKSQVVISLLANAYLHGKPVLFASYNQKAVSVVEERLNALSPFPLVIRLGKRSGDRDLRQELISLLERIRTARVSEADRDEERKARAEVENLERRRSDLMQKLEEFRSARNKLDKLDQEIDEAREIFPAEFWEHLGTITDWPELANIEQAFQLVVLHLEKGGGLLKWLRRYLRRRKDFKQVTELSFQLANQPQVWGTIPDTDPCLQNLSAWQHALQTAIDRLRIAHKLAEYWKGYESLKHMPSTEDAASRLAEIEDQLWQGGSQLIRAYGRLLPDRVTPDTRVAIGEFQATLKRLAQDELGGKAFAQLIREQELIFAKVAQILPVWCVTNLSARGVVPFDSALFDLVVIDEASQCDIPSVLPLLYRAKRALIIGDSKQLRHIATLATRRDQQLQAQHGLNSAADMPFTFINNSLFDLAETYSGKENVVGLREHFRSHADIINFSNELWYENTLQVCTDYRRLRSPDGQSPGVIWTSVRGKVIRPLNGGAFNIEEARAVADRVIDLLETNRFSGSVGVVTPFREQASRIRELVNTRLDPLLIERSRLVVAAAHGFQGDERDVIFLSPCIGPDMPRGAKHFLESTSNLLNVAVTRARSLLHVVGDMEMCRTCGVSHIERLAAYVEQMAQKPSRAEFEGEVVGYWEPVFYEALKAAGLKPIPQYPVHHYNLDFAIIDGDTHLDIEIDGEFYHQEWNGTRCREDLKRDRRLMELGWTVKRFWVYRLREEMSVCIQEIVDLVAKSSDLNLKNSTQSQS